MTDTMTTVNDAPAAPGPDIQPTPGQAPEPPSPATPESMAPPADMGASNADAEAMPSTDATPAPQPIAEEKPKDISTVPDKKEPKGIKAEIKNTADDYVIPMSDAAIEQWSKALDGKDVGPFKEYAQQIAVGLYPTLAPQIQMGLPTRVLLDPYIQVASQILGPVMTEPDWTDPKWGAALQGGQDLKTGRPVPMTLDQWGKYLRSDPAHNYADSPQGQDRMQNFLQTMNDAFNGNPNAGSM
jgi:hypothetical protein